MNKHKPTQPRIITVALVSLFVIICLLGLVILDMKASLGLLYGQESQHTLEQSYRLNRIIFCYDNNIRPCSDDNLTTWNDAHPNVADQFTISPPSFLR